MNKLVLIAAASALGLAACAGPSYEPRLVLVGEDADIRLRVKPDAANVEIFVDTTASKARIVVDQEPVYALVDPLDTKKKKIKFKLQQNYTFAANGIELCPASPAHKVCKTKPTNPSCVPPQGGGRVMTCSYDAPAADTVYYYTIRILDAAGNPLTLDPSVWN